MAMVDDARNVLIVW